MAMRIGLVCLLWAAGAVAQCGVDSWYGGPDELPSTEDRVPSFEEASDEYYPVKQQRYHRSSRYSPGYGYGNELQQDSGDWERYGPAAPRKPPMRYDAHKSRRKYGTYGKSSRAGYSYKSSLDVDGYERKKTSRAAKYTVEGGPQGKTTSLTFKAVAPKANCAQNLLIGCTPTVTRVPCSAAAPYEAYGGHPGGTPYYPPMPMYHHAPPAHYGPPPPPATYPGYPTHPSGYYPPPPPPSYPAPATTGPQAYSKPAEGATHGHAPSYKVATQEEVPGFAAPVREEMGESPKMPIISAFHKPSAPSDGPTAGTAVNGTADQGTPTSTTAHPLPVLTTTTTAAHEDTDEFWGAESNSESSTNVYEGSTAR